LDARLTTLLCNKFVAESSTEGYRSKRGVLPVMMILPMFRWMLGSFLDPEDGDSTFLLIITAERISASLLVVLIPSGAGKSLFTTSGHIATSIRLSSIFSGLFNDAGSIADYIASNGGMTDKNELERVWKEAILA
jgi:hypothetical protein